VGRKEDFLPARNSYSRGLDPVNSHGDVVDNESVFINKISDGGCEDRIATREAHGKIDFGEMG